MFFKRKTQEGSLWTGVARDGTSVCAAQVSHREGERPRVLWLWQEQAPTLEEGLRALQASKIVKYSTVVGLLDRTQYRLLATEAPQDIARTDWRDAMRWQLKEQVDFPVEDAVLDVLEVPQNTQRRQSCPVMVFMLPRTDYDVVALAADDVGLTWAALEAPETALRNLSALSEEDDKAHALMVFGEEHGILVITVKGELLMARQIEVALASVTGSNEVRGAALSRAALEILRTIDTFERMHSEVVLSGMTVALPPGCGEDVLEMLADLIYVPLQALKLSTWFDLDTLADEADHLSDHATFSQLCVLGATLREPGSAGERQQLQLLDATSVLGQSVPWGALLGARLVGGVLALGTAVGLGLTAATSAYKLKGAELDADLAGLRATALAHPISPVVRELDGLRQKEAQQRQMQEALQGSMTWSSQGYSDYLMALGRQATPSVWINHLEMTGDGRDVVLGGRTNNSSALPSYFKRLGQEDRFKGRRFAQLDISAIPSDGNLAAGVVQFSLRSVGANAPRNDPMGKLNRQEALQAVGGTRSATGEGDKK
ncbi:MAG: hypothetical protein Q7U28_12030 [Aquabacterium sp.]|nr:hypothetical protein [Aquabacterium sp.]